LIAIKIPSPRLLFFWRSQQDELVSGHSDVATQVRFTAE
jgi:hypothetical protein